MYFVTTENAKGGCFHEFQRGGIPSSREYKLDKKDSLYLHDDIMDDTKFNAFLEEVSKYDYYNWPVSFTEKEWKHIYQEGIKEGGVIKELVEELNVWAEEVFAEYKRFTVYGL